MTKINYKDYTLESEENATDRFNLTKKDVTRARTQKMADEKKVNVGDIIGEKIVDVAFGLTLQSSIERMAYDIMANKEEVYTLQSYMKELRDVIAEITKAVKP